MQFSTEITLLFVLHQQNAYCYFYDIKNKLSFENKHSPLANGHSCLNVYTCINVVVYVLYGLQMELLNIYEQRFA